MPQSNWQYCKKCEGLFFAGNNLGVCPAGGAHDDSSSGGYSLPDSGAGQSNWRWCSRCQGLFFAGNDLGVCPTHSDTGSGNYVLPTSGAGQTGWKWCSKCQGLFFAGNNLGVCSAGGAHNDSTSGAYVIPSTGAGQSDWKWCSKCQGLFFAGNNLGGCPDGGAHNDSTSGNYILPSSGAGQSGWKWCNQCQGLFFAGNGLGVCPTPHPHTDAGSDNYVLATSGAGQSNWKWCNRCQGLFYASSNGICPSRAGQATNQPSTHNGSTSGDYLLTLLGSNSNYIFDSNCTSLINVSVTIDVTQAIVCESASGSTKGFGFQLNAYSPKGETSAWQQYVMALFGSEVIGAVDNWPVSGSNIINDFFNLTALSSAEIPAGYKLKISLQNDSKGNVTGATYVVINNLGTTLANVPLTLLSISGVTSADLAPIVAFELNLVGPVNGESAVLSSGAGTITYTSSSVLTPLIQEPSCTESGYVTAETANSYYSSLPATPSNTFTQTFNVSIVSAATPLIRKRGKIRPSTRR